MPHYVTTNRIIAIGAISVLFGAVLGCVIYVSSRDASSSGKNEWPPLTMVYEVDGLTWNGRTVK